MVSISFMKLTNETWQEKVLNVASVSLFLSQPELYTVPTYIHTCHLACGSFEMLKPWRVIDDQGIVLSLPNFEAIPMHFIAIPWDLQ